MESDWENLDSELVKSIANLLSEPDFTSFRSVCRNWRLCIHPRYPLRVPYATLQLQLPYVFRKQDKQVMVVDCKPVYQFHPRNECKGDDRAVGLRGRGATSAGRGRGGKTIAMRDGRLYRVWARPNGGRVFLSLYSTGQTMELQDPLTIELSKFEILEVSQGAGIYIRDSGRYKVKCKRVIVAYTLLNPPLVVMLKNDGKLMFWRNGDDNWTFVEMKGYILQDFVLHKGLSSFYGICKRGLLVCFDFNFNLHEMTTLNAHPPFLRYGTNRSVLVEYKSDIYAVARTRVVTVNDLPFDYCFRMGMLKVYKWGWKECAWLLIRKLDKCALILGEDIAFGLSAWDFKNCKTWNFVSFEMKLYDAWDTSKEKAVYYLENDELEFLDHQLELKELFWSIPHWLKDFTTSQLIADRIGTCGQSEAININIEE